MPDVSTADVQNTTDYSDLLPLLRFQLREPEENASCGCSRLFSDEQLLALLARHGGDVNAASYEGLLLKAETDALRLPDGLTLPDARAYWLGLAGLYRPCVGRHVPRADEGGDNQ